MQTTEQKRPLKFFLSIHLHQSSGMCLHFHGKLMIKKLLRIFFMKNVRKARSIFIKKIPLVLYWTISYAFRFLFILSLKSFLSKNLKRFRTFGISLNSNVSV